MTKETTMLEPRLVVVANDARDEDVMIGGADGRPQKFSVTFEQWVRYLLSHAWWQEGDDPNLVDAKLAAADRVADAFVGRKAGSRVVLEGADFAYLAEVVRRHGVPPQYAQGNGTVLAIHFRKFQVAVTGAAKARDAVVEEPHAPEAPVNGVAATS